MDATSREGLLFASRADLYTVFQKKLYTESRAQLERNGAYLSQTGAGISRLLQEYFMAVGLRAVCIFDLPTAVSIPEG
jgi:hypothetical protein